MDEELLKGAPLLVLANKQDLPDAATPSEVTKALGLHGIRGRDWFIQGATATKNQGLAEGMDWLSRAVRSKK